MKLIFIGNQLHRLYRISKSLFWIVGFAEGGEGEESSELEKFFGGDFPDADDLEFGAHSGDLEGVLIDSRGISLAEVDDDLADSELREFSMESKSVVGKTKGDDFFGIDLEFDVEDFVIPLEQDEAIGTNGFEGEFCGVEDG